MLETLRELDEGLLLLVQGMRADWLNPLVEGYTSLGDAGMAWIVLSLVMLCWKPTRKAGVLALAAMILGAVITNVTLKPLVARPRPWLDVEGLIPLIHVTDPDSFPSGHTCAAFAVGTIWAKTLPSGWMRVLAVVMELSMGFSRLYLGVHYPSDVLGGALVGTLCAFAAWKGYGALAK